MYFEDARDRTIGAVQLLESQKIQIDCPHLKIRTVQEFLEYAQSMKLTRYEKETIVEQAILLIDQFYAHLPYKRARYATDPVQRLRLIHAQLDHLSDLAFHDQMLQVFMRLRDAHTFYGLPRPFRGAFAFLPFRLACFHDKSGHRRFLVTNVLDGFDHPRFAANAEITSWQGMPVERAIECEGDLEPGGNPASRFVRGMKRLTKRSLAFSVPPDESYVVLQYIPCTGGSEQYSIVLPWYVAMECIPDAQRRGSASSLNESQAELAKLGRILWKGTEVAKEANGIIDFRHVSVYPHVFEFQHSGGTRPQNGIDPASLHDPAHPDRKFGYIRIRTFDIDPSDENDSGRFFSEFVRILGIMKAEAPDGLILDVRSNPGGEIDAAERLLQLLTPSEIEPAKFHFINSRITQHIASNLRATGNKNSVDTNHLEWLPWAGDLRESVSSGRVVTPGKPLTSFDQANDTGQLYQGPVTLIIDALSYSATDIFAAGFQDHRIGPIIGVDENTGGGGANRWLHEELRLKLAGVPDVPLKKLPGGAQLGLAIRRSTRVGANSGGVLEDLGVRCDVKYRITRNDLLNHDRELLQFACRQLGAQPSRLLKILSAKSQPGGIAITVRTQNLYRLECLVNNMPQCSFAADAPQPFFVPTAGMIDPAAVLRVNGFALVTGRAGVQQLQPVAADTLAIEGESSSVAGA